MQRHTHFILFFCSILITVGLFLFVHETNLGGLIRNELALIFNIESSAVKEWQRNFGLQKDFGIGAKGEDVFLLQKALATDKEIYPEKKITGVFGTTTRAALIRFQTRYNLTPTGVIDRATRETLNQIYFYELCPKQEEYFPDLTLATVGKNNPLPKNYIPAHLVDISKQVKTMGIMCLDSETALHLTEMFTAAKNENIILAVSSGFRHPSIQKLLYDYWISQNGTDAQNEIALPGYSEHQLGTTVDLTGKSIDYALVDPRFANSSEGLWLTKHAYEFGFVMSYPKDKVSVTGYNYEPWHYRYIGAAEATALHETSLTLNQYTAARERKPLLRKNVTGQSYTARAIFSSYISSDGTEKKLMSHDADQVYPIASLTKLMTALVALKNYPLSKILTVDRSSIVWEEYGSGLIIGEKYSVAELLHMLLIESNNTSAKVLAAGIGEDAFIEQMNAKAVELGMTHTQFHNPTGLDDNDESKMNFSSASDLARLGSYIVKEAPYISSLGLIKEYIVKTASKGRARHLSSTNKLLMASAVPVSILAGKTGDTDKAKKNLLLVTDAPNKNGVIVNIVLGSDDHFKDMEDLISWTQNSYVW